MLQGRAAAALLLAQAWPRGALGGCQQPAAPLPGQPRHAGGARGWGSPQKKRGGSGSAGVLCAVEAGTRLVRARATGLGVRAAAASGHQGTGLHGMSSKHAQRQAVGARVPRTNQRILKS